MSEWILCKPIHKKTNKQNIKKYISTQKPVQIYLIIQINIGIFARESTTKTWTAFQYGVKKLQRCCNENATLNRILNIHIEQKYFGIIPFGHVQLVQCRRCTFSSAWHEWFLCKGKELLLRARVVVRTSNMTLSRRLADYTSKNCTRERAARAAGLFFLIQLIKLLICGVVVAVTQPWRRLKC